MAFLDRFKKGAGLVCPRCEAELQHHDDEKCARKMTRRHFVGMWGAAVAVAYGVTADGAPKIVLATPAHVKRIENEIGDGAWMVSARGGYVVTSRMSLNRDTGRLQNGSIVRDTRMQEVLKLRAQGFQVTLSQDEERHRAQARGAPYWPDAQADSEFPSVERW